MVATHPSSSADNSPVFLIVNGGRGGGGHSVGALFILTAHQHIRDIQSGKFPGLPKSAGAKIVGPVTVTSVTALNDLLGKYTNIKYLAYHETGKARFERRP
jgi:hypothetical protein